MNSQQHVQKGVASVSDPTEHAAEMWTAEGRTERRQIWQDGVSGEAEGLLGQQKRKQVEASRRSASQEADRQSDSGQLIRVEGGSFLKQDKLCADANDPGEWR